MNDIGLTSAIQSIRPSAEAFLHWWGAGLAGLVPAQVKRLLSKSRPSVVFDVCPEGTGVRLTGSFKGKDETVITPRLEADGSNTLSWIARQLRRTWRGRDVVVRLPVDKFLVRELEFPVAARSKVGDVLALDLERSMPFSPDEVVSSYRLAETYPGDSTLKVTQFVLKRSILERSLADLKRENIVPDYVEPDEGDKTSAPVRIPLKHAELSRFDHTVRIVNRALAGLIIILAAVGLYMLFEREEIKLAKLDAEIAALKKQAAARKRANAGLRASLKVTVDLTRRQAGKSVIATLEALTKTLPDHSWVYTVNLRRDDVSLAGFSQSPADLIGLIEKSELFFGAAFTSPVRHDTRPGVGEHFNIALKTRSSRLLGEANRDARRQK